MDSYPLIVDLDGTLVLTDTMHESVLRAIHANPFSLFGLIHHAFSGKAAFKQYLAGRTPFDPASLPYNQELLSWLKEQHAQGRTLILCTASDASIANAVALYLGIFSEVIASNGVVNLAGKYKAETLTKRFGSGGFDYVGNGGADLAVWQYARRAIIVNASSNLAERAAKCCEIEKIIPSHPIGYKSWLQALRVHQWLKNTLVFIPFVASHQIFNFKLYFPLILAFVAFSLCASSVYILNDLLDLESDRQHPHKYQRPFASGVIPVWMGVALAPLLLLVSFLMAHKVNNSFLLWIIFYFILTFLYSLIIKKIVILDCLILAILYALRLVAGGAAAGISLSFWLLAYSVFLFLSLAFVKRYVELGLKTLNGKENTGRGYRASDAPFVKMQGIAAGYSSTLILALYINSSDIIKLYKLPALVWGTVPVMLFWTSWVWLQAHRGNIKDDPLVFALQDRTSLLLGVIFYSFLLAGTVGWRW